jgi:hypothetical protein
MPVSFRRLFAALPLLALAAPLCAADRINHAGRVLGPQVPVTIATPFNTPEADTVTSSLQIYPTSNAWNEDVSTLPPAANSDAMMTQINNDLSSTRRHLTAFFEMNYVHVPDNQPPVAINLFQYPADSQPSPYPIPSTMPIEAWPHDYPTYTLTEMQTDSHNDGGDRHAVVVMPGAGHTWEMWQAKFITGTGWEAANGAYFNLSSNAQWPDTWTSADASGMSLFAALPRYDECQRGVIEHAMRIVVQRSRTSYIYPASHQAGSTTLTTVPAMGQRIRLKASYVVPGTWSVCEKAVAAALKKYGALVADNGNFFSISVTPDQRWGGSEFSNLNSLAILGAGSVPNFEVVQSTGATTGPRAPGAPAAYAGIDKTVALSPATVTLSDATASGTGISILWAKYSGPGTVTFGNAATLTTTASFAVAGRYILELKVSDATHTPAWAIVGVTVTPSCAAPPAAISLTKIGKSGVNPLLNFTDPNAAAGVTGYNIYRAPHPATRPGLWGKPGANVADADGGTAGIQWTDAASNNGSWFYTVAAWNNTCNAEGPW